MKRIWTNEKIWEKCTVHVILFHDKRRPIHKRSKMLLGRSTEFKFIDITLWEI